MALLENEHLIAEVSGKGAELKSLRRRDDEHEYMWEADPAYWAKTSPVLFPIVGALKGNTYFFKNKAYQLPRHGFARDLVFEEEPITQAEVAFTLTDSEKTRAVYPFAFRLTLRYRLMASSLICTYEVHNPDENQVLLFAIGGHPAFAAGRRKGIAYEDHYLEFPDDETLQGHPLTDGGLIADGDTRAITLENHRLPLTHQLFRADALVMKNLKSRQITLRNGIDERGIHFKHDQFPFFGIWAAKDADFVCLEPWCGIADGAGHNQQLEEKEGMERLGTGETWVRSWEVVCF